MRARMDMRPLAVEKRKRPDVQRPDLLAKLFGAVNKALPHPANPSPEGASRVVRGALSAITNPANLEGASSIGIRLGKGAAKATKAKERIVAAAIRAQDGRVFTGSWHGAAEEAAEAAGTVALNPDVGDGFVTSTGRFVTREEATLIAKRSKQSLVGTTDPRETPEGYASSSEDIDMDLEDIAKLKLDKPTGGDNVASRLRSRVKIAPSEADNTLAKINPAQTKFAEQKVFLMPDELIGDYAPPAAPAKKTNGIGGGDLIARTGAQSAIVHNGRLFLGNSHNEAYERAIKEVLGVDLADIKDGTPLAAAADDLVDNSDEGWLFGDKLRSRNGLPLQNSKGVDYDAEALLEARDAGRKPKIEAPNIVVPQKQDARKSAIQRVREGMKTGKSRNAVREEIISTLTPAEVKSFEKDPELFMRNYLAMPTPGSLASTSIAGSDLSGWYTREGGAMREAFGDDDFPRFATLAAALSPQAEWSKAGSKHTNVVWALNAWKEWNKLGRGTDPETLDKVARASGHMLSKGKGEGIKTILPGIRSALATPMEQIVDPNVSLLGPKTESFRWNLMGDLDRLTMDTHEAHRFGGKEGSQPGTLSRNIPARAVFRNASKDLEERTGFKSPIGNMQSMDWGFIQGARLLGKGKPGSNEAYVRRMLEEGGGSIGGTSLEKHIKGAPTMRGLFNTDPIYREALGGAGGKLPASEAKLSPGIDPKLADPKHLIDAAQRSDMARAEKYLYGLAPFLVGGGLFGAQFNRQQ